MQPGNRSNFPNRPMRHARPAGSRYDKLWNRLTAGIVILSVMVAVWFSWIFFSPDSRLNPFPPTASPVENTPVTAFSTLMAVPDPVTPTHEPQAVVETTPQDNLETPSIPTRDVAEPTQTPTRLPTKLGGGQYTFASQSDPKFIDATLFRPEHGCRWMGIAGQVFDLQGRPAAGITVQIAGVLGGKNFNRISLTGTALSYGQAGYEITLTEGSIKSSESLSVQLLDQAMQPLSPKAVFNTSEDCEKNLVVVNFIQVR